MTANEITAQALKCDANTASMLKVLDKTEALEAAVEATLTVLTNAIQAGKVTAADVVEQDLAKQGPYTMLAKQGVERSLLHQDTIRNIVRMLNNTISH